MLIVTKRLPFHSFPPFSGDAVVAPVSVMNVSWSADHRVVEGATIARFSNKFKQYVENPALMVAELR